jgi:hypothetical protein
MKVASSAPAPAVDDEEAELGALLAQLAASSSAAASAPGGGGGMFSGGGANDGSGAPDFDARLADEIAALEEANVRALMLMAGGGAGAADDATAATAADPTTAAASSSERDLSLALGRAGSLLDDLAESLRVFNFKLGHMRTDIAAIERCGKELETAARNDGRLLTALDGLLADTRDDGGSGGGGGGGGSAGGNDAHLLENPNLDPFGGLRQTVAAAWALRDRMARLGCLPAATDGGPSAAPPPPPPISGLLFDARAVREARQRARRLAARFVERAGGHLQSLVAGLAAEAMADLNHASGSSLLLRPPPRTAMRQTLARHAPLVEAVAALDPAALASLRAQYAQAVGALIRRELRGAAGELRRLAMQAAGGGSGGGAAAAAPRSFSPAFALGPVITSDDDLRALLMLTVDGGDNDDDEDALLRRRDAAAASTTAAASRRRLERARAVSAAGGPVPLARAFDALLDAFVPRLLGELAFASRFLGLEKRSRRRREGEGFEEEEEDDDDDDEGASAPLPLRPSLELSEEGAAVAAALVDGVAEELALLADLAAPTTTANTTSHPPPPAADPYRGPFPAAQAVPMMIALRRWLGRLSAAAAAASAAAGDSDDSGPSVASAAVLARPLTATAARLSRHLDAAVAALIAAADAAHDAGDAGGGSGGGAAGGNQKSVKALRMLPAIAAYTRLAEDVESLFEDALEPAEAAAIAAAAASEASHVDAAAAASVAAAVAAAAAATSGAPDATTTTAAVAAAESARAALAVRAGLDARLHGALAARAAACVARTAALDPKHGDRLALENFCALADALERRVLLPRRALPAVARAAAQARAARDAALDSYARAQLEYAGLLLAVEAGERLGAAAAGGGGGGGLAASPPPPTPAELKQALRLACEGGGGGVSSGGGAGGGGSSSSSVGAGARAEAAAARVRKHLLPAAPRAADLAWRRVGSRLLAAWRALEAHGPKVYPGMVPSLMRPQTERELREAVVRAGNGIVVVVE